MSGLFLWGAEFTSACGETVNYLRYNAKVCLVISMLNDLIIPKDTIEEIVGQEVSYLTDPEQGGDQKLPEGVTEADVAEAFREFCREDIWDFLCKESEVFFGTGMKGVAQEVKAYRKKVKQ